MLKNKKRIILILLVATAALPIPFAYSPVSSLESLLRLVGQVTGLVGTVLLLWQYLIGFRGVNRFLTRDLFWINKVHRFIGKYGILLIALHPVLLFLYYLSLGVNLISFSLETPFAVYKMLGVIAFSFLAFIWVMSAILKGKIGFRPWKRIHLLNYFLLPLVIIHGLGIGNILLRPELKAIWIIVASVYVLITIYRTLWQLGLLRKRYVVLETAEVAHNVTKISLTPKDKHIVPDPGQFIYLQLNKFGESHPFTASHFDPKTNVLSISPKCSGKFSCVLQGIQPGTEVFIDGPYGIFTKQMQPSLKPVVLIAGGIGITPFLRFIPLAAKQKRELWLFYGNKTAADIAYAEDLEKLTKQYPNFHLVHVLSQEAQFLGEKGRITAELIKRYVPSLTKFNYLVCGPRPMQLALISQLKSEGVKAEQIETETFSL